MFPCSCIAIAALLRYSSHHHHHRDHQHHHYNHHHGDDAINNLATILLFLMLFVVVALLMVLCGFSSPPRSINSIVVRLAASLTLLPILCYELLLFAMNTNVADFLPLPLSALSIHDCALFVLQGAVGQEASLFLRQREEVLSASTTLEEQDQISAQSLQNLKALNLQATKPLQ